MSAAQWWRPAPVDRDLAREAVEACRDSLDDAREALAVACAVIQTLAAIVPDRPCDVAAELAILGWLLGGAGRMEDVAELVAYDFSSRARRWVFGLAVEALSMPRTPTWPASRLVRHAAIEHAPDDLIGEILAVCDAAAASRPDSCPMVDGGVVVALGRRWSVVDDAERGVS